MLTRSRVFAAFSLLATAQAQSLGDALSGNDDLSILASLAQKLDLAGMLSGDSYTILAPNNAAFDGIDTKGATAMTMVNGVPLSDLLQYHVIDGSALMAADFGEAPYGNISSTLLSSSDYVNIGDAPQVVNPVRNGSVVEIYSGAKNASKVVTPDLSYDNGVIHIIDTLLAVPLNISGISKQNSSLSLSKFTTALSNANISTMVNSQVNLTIFAPASSGFSSANIYTPLVDPTRLKDIFDYHIVAAGEVLYSDQLWAMANNTNITTIQGTDLIVHFNGSHILINNSTIKTSNVLIENGVVHIIDYLLNPDSTKGFSGGFKPKPNAAPAMTISSIAVGLVVAAVSSFFI